MQGGMLRARTVVDILSTDERSCETFFEPINLVWIISKSVVVRHVVEKFLRIQSTTEQKREISIRCFDDVRNDSYCTPPIECLFVAESFFDEV